MQRPPAFLKTGWIHRLLGGPKAAEAFRDFVEEWDWESSPWQKLASADVLGGVEFLDHLRKQVGDADGELARQQRHMSRPTLDELQAAHTERAEWMARAFRDHGYTLNEIADHADLHYSSISKIVKAWTQGKNAKAKT